MRLTLLAWLVVLARLTIYCNRGVLSLPPSLIANAASFRQHQLQQHSSPQPDSWEAAALEIQQQHHHPHQQKKKQLANALYNRPWKKDTQFVDGAATIGQSVVERAPEDVRVGYDNIVPSQSSNSKAKSNNNKNNGNMDYKKSTTTTATILSNSEYPQQQGESVHKQNAKLVGKYDLSALLTAAAAAAKLSSAQDADDSLPNSRAVKSSVPFTPLQYWARYCQSDGNCPEAYYRDLLADR